MSDGKARTAGRGGDRGSCTVCMERGGWLRAGVGRGLKMREQQPACGSLDKESSQNTPFLTLSLSRTEKCVRKRQKPFQNFMLTWLRKASDTVEVENVKMNFLKSFPAYKVLGKPSWTQFGNYWPMCLS